MAVRKKSRTAIFLYEKRLPYKTAA